MKNTMYKRITKPLQSAFVSFSLLLVSIVSFTVLFSPIPVQAQNASSGGPGVGFSECQFDPSTQTGGDVSIQRCLGQIFQFTFVVGMFIIAIRVGIFAIGNYNPFDNGRAVNDSIRIVWEATLGFILLGSPVLVINIFNPAALNLSFLNLGSVAPGASPFSDGGGGGGDTTSGEQSDPALDGGNGPSSGDLSDALDQTGARSNRQTVARFIAGPGLIAQAQDSGLSDQEAIEIITEVLEAELECRKFFITALDFSNCQILEDPAFVTQRNRISDRLRELYTPLIEQSKFAFGNIVVSRDVEVLPINIQSDESLNEGCQFEYAMLKEVNSLNKYLVSTEFCSDNNFESAIWIPGENGLDLQSGTVVSQGDKILTSGTLQILN
jgi:hypothetical protein